MIDNFSLAIVSLGASVAAILLAMYLIAKDRRFSGKDPGPFTAKSPPLAPEPFGVRLKKRLDKK